MDAGNSLTCWPNTAYTGEAEIQMAIWTPVNIVKMLIGGFGTVSTEGFDSPTNHFGVVYDANTVGSNPAVTGANRSPGPILLNKIIELCK